MYSTDINNLLGEASKLYSKKEFDDASEKYAEACELYSTEKGEDDPDLLLLYGKSLFQSAVSKSEVFGGKVNENKENSDEEKEQKGDEDKDEDNFQFCDDAPLAEEDDDVQHQPQEEEEEDEANDNENEQENEEEQSDFEIAWEILDLARALFEKKIEAIGDCALEVPYLKNDKEEPSNEYVVLTKKLSETYDLLGEVSLEAENFQQSAIDLEKCLNLRLKLYNKDTSALISESHYKLSLALEFCVEDPDLRKKAEEQMRLAIESVKLRNSSEKDVNKQKDNKELLQDLEVRYQELKRNPEEDIKNEQMDIIKGILGEATLEDTQAKVNELKSLAIQAKSPAVNDLTSIVKKRKSKPNTLPTKKAKK